MLETKSTPIYESLGLGEILKAEIFKPKNGKYQDKPDYTVCVNDLITNLGREYIAARMTSVADATINSLMGWMAVGTVATAAALTNSLCTGEVARNALSAYSAASNIITATMTFGGSSDSVTSLSLVEAGIFNHTQSGTGIMMQRVTFSAVILANSDILKLTLETNVGSNTI